MVHVTDLALTKDTTSFFTTAIINDQPAQLQVDTGSTDNLLTEAAAQRLGLAVDASYDQQSSGIGGVISTGIARTKHVELGGLHGKQLEFETVLGARTGLDKDGLIGMNFLTPYDMDLDFWGGRVGLFKTLGDCNVPQAALGPPLYAVDMTPFQDDNRPTVMVTINGRRLRAVIDTGASHTLVFRDRVDAASLDQASILASGMVRGVGPRARKADIRLSAPVEIGDLTIRNMPIVVIDERHSAGVDMLLGYDFVTRVHIWISHSSRSIIMQYPPTASPTVADK